VLPTREMWDRSPHHDQGVEHVGSRGGSAGTPAE
jgi:hypothetical protein